MYRNKSLLAELLSSHLMKPLESIGVTTMTNEGLG